MAKLGLLTPSPVLRQQEQIFGTKARGEWENCHLGAGSGRIEELVDRETVFRAIACCGLGAG